MCALAMRGWPAVLLMGVLLLAGCTTPQSSALRLRVDPAMPGRHELIDVAFYPQELYQCGPAALATLLRTAGVEVSPDALVAHVYRPGREGVLYTEIMAATRLWGRLAYPLAPRLSIVLAEVAAGRPVLVLQNLGWVMLPRWHYAVVVGYDLEREQIILRSGSTRRLVMPMMVFERTWARSGYWSMTVLSPEVIPEGVDGEGWIAATVALERGSIAAARLAYQSAQKRWPSLLLAVIGAGNMAYGMGDLVAAEDAYRRAIERHPTSADAWNNLATVLDELGRSVEALAAIDRAIALAGPRIESYRATRTSIISRAMQSATTAM